MDPITIGFYLAFTGILIKLLPNILKLIENVTDSLLKILYSAADLLNYLIPKHSHHLNDRFFGNSSNSVFSYLKNTLLCITQGLLFEFFIYRSYEQQSFHFNYRNMPDISANKKYPLLCLFLVGIAHPTASIADGLIDIIQFVINSTELLIDSTIGQSKEQKSDNSLKSTIDNALDSSLTNPAIAHTSNLVSDSQNSDISNSEENKYQQDDDLYLRGLQILASDSPVQNNRSKYIQDHEKVEEMYSLLLYFNEPVTTTSNNPADKNKK